MDDKLAADEARRSVQHEAVKANVEGEVQDDAGEQPAVDVEQSEPDRGDHQFQGPREGRLIRVRRVAGVCRQPGPASLG